MTYGKTVNAHLEQYCRTKLDELMPPEYAAKVWNYLHDEFSSDIQRIYDVVGSIIRINELPLREMYEKCRKSGRFVIYVDKDRNVITSVATGNMPKCDIGGALTTSPVFCIDRMASWYIYYPEGWNHEHSGVLDG